MTFRCRPDDGPLILAFESPIPHKLKKRCQSWTPSDKNFFYTDFMRCPSLLVGPICNNFEKNRAFYDKSMKLGAWLVNNKTRKIRVSATPKMSSNGRHLVFPNGRLFQLIHFNPIIYLQTSCFLQLILLK